ncbi:MAG: glycogen-binding domain-containing protein [Candidatus Eisenbacteria bacterium]
MRLWTWHSGLPEVFANRYGLLRGAIVLLTSMALVLVAAMSFLLVAATPAACAWQVAPEVRVSVGDESDLVIDPELSRIIVPGGLFVELTSAVSARGWLGRRTFVDLGTSAALQRFLNEESRLIYAHTVSGSAFQNLTNSIRGRLSTTLGYFDDSQIETVRRFGVGAEVGVALLRSRWNMEVWGGGGTRRYPNLTLAEPPDRTAEYTETSWSTGTTLRFSPGENVDLGAGGTYLVTDSQDPFFDSSSWMLNASAGTRLVGPLFLSALGAYQTREFDARTPGENNDEYWQVCLGLRCVVRTGLSASVRWGYSEYTWPAGISEASHRLTAELHYAWGRPNVMPLPGVDVAALTRASGGSIQTPDSNGSVCLRVLAPTAHLVTVAGSFNAWDSEATPLLPAGDGWWEACIKLAPGVYEYAYVIDDAWTAPPEAKTTAEDGFGGRNGILEVLPAGL